MSALRLPGPTDGSSIGGGARRTGKGLDDGHDGLLELRPPPDVVVEEVVSVVIQLPRPVPPAVRAIVHVVPTLLSLLCAALRFKR